jgi:4-amino-4-deoxy-L-arabinose transferase-like glycosyltransferase
MSVPSSPVPVSEPNTAGRWAGALGRRASLALVLELALALRVVAALAIEWLVHRKGTGTDPVPLCLFPDTRIYWELARALRAGGPYEIVDYSDIPHFALRTPGYPMMLAACQVVFGERTLAVRLVQAVLGTLCVYLVYCLARQLDGESPSARSVKAPGRRWTIPLIAAALTAFNPYSVMLSVLILSEAVFEPMMLASLLGLAVLWGRAPEARGSRRGGWAAACVATLVPLGSGAAAGAAVLVRPSWALFLPVMLVAWVVARRGDRRVLAGAGLCVLGVVLTMAPWWYRNWQVYGRFVPTALWFGASLYDGLNPKATGASNMDEFRADPAIWPLDEQDQDAELSRRAWDFAREQPLRVLWLAAVKFGRYWSPWPNAEGFRNPVLAVASSVVELPVFILMAMGLWVRRRDGRAWVLLAGPILYFCAVHLVFASSMRYRIPGEVPALSLAASGLAAVCGPWSLRTGRSVRGFPQH